MTLLNQIIPHQFVMLFIYKDWLEYFLHEYFCMNRFADSYSLHIGFYVHTSMNAKNIPVNP